MTDRYENPLCARYASAEMQRLFSDDEKFSGWRRLWVALAESQLELGLPLESSQIEEMAAHISDINYDAAKKIEAETQHDVMAHILAYGEQCPAAKPIIHLGATSSYVKDNTDLIIMRQAISKIKKMLLGVVASLCELSEKYAALPCLGFTHFRPAQPTTFGKRATLWIQDFLLDLDSLDFAFGQIKFLGCKGATGTAASFLALFDGDKTKTAELERKIAKKLDFSESYPVSGQTYPRKVDFIVLSALSGIAQSAYKFSTDIRLLSNLGELDEGFAAEKQVGSSAMPYKKNPIKSERVASLARLVMNNLQNASQTAASAWLERTLDDSANRRIVIPETFLAADGILSLLAKIIQNLSIYPRVMERNLSVELPFLLTENILMLCVKLGGDRQRLHERIRIHSSGAMRKIKDGGENDLLSRIAGDEEFPLNLEDIAKLAKEAKLVGMAEEQTLAFLEDTRLCLRQFAE